MENNRLSRLWRRLNDWVNGLAPEHHEQRGMIHEVRSTKELEKDYLERAVPAPQQSRNRHRTFLERYSEWERGFGLLHFDRVYRLMAVVICIVFISILLLTVSYLPSFGDPGNLTNNEVFVKYIEDTLTDTNATNAVAGIILDYRAFDTFGEATVLFAASCAVLILLRDDKGESKRSSLLGEMREPQQDTILTKVSMLVIPMLLLYGVYVILNGHISPGGGFSGGTIIGAGLILYLSAFGSRQTGRLINARVYTIVNFCALSFYGLAKGYSFFTGANHLESGIPHGEPGAILSGGLILPLNIAVGLVVACTMYGFYALFSKGEI